MVRLSPYSKANTVNKSHKRHLLSSFFIFGLIGIFACTTERIQQQQTADPVNQLKNSPMVTGQTAPPVNIRSIQVYREDKKASIPAIQLNSDEYITMRFDELGESGRMFRVRVRHRDADWSASNLMSGFYLGGYREDLISGGQPSSVQQPDYTHYSYRFPNENMRVTMSGNYLLEVLDYETSTLLFSVPFFVYENQGQVDISLERLYGQDSRYLKHHQPFGSYRYPRFVISPTQDLRMFFVQNRFWGRARETDVQDVSESGIYRSYLSRDYSFVGVYEFRPLNLRRYDDPGRDVIDIRSETIPPRVILRRDVVNLDVNPPRRSPALHGQPRDDRNARYVDVRFELELPRREETNLPVYVYGPFNNWTINEQSRMEYRESTNSYTGNVIVKEGNYDYKYAIVEDGVIDDFRLDASFASTRQEYTALIYFWDSSYQADRLLMIDSFIAQ